MSEAKADHEARLKALEEHLGFREVGKHEHCWDPVLDQGAQVPVYIPIDPFAQPVRYRAVTRAEEMVVHFRCCHCKKTAERRFELRRVDAKGKHASGDHGEHHEVFDHYEATPLPAGPCTGRHHP